MKVIFYYFILSFLSIMLCSPLTAQQLSSGDLSVENQAYITSILRAMGVEQEFVLCKPLEALLLNQTDFATIVTAPQLKYMYINQDWFDGLREQERRFVIGHEAALLKDQRIAEKAFDGVLAAASVCAGIKTYAYIHTKSHANVFKRCIMSIAHASIASVVAATSWHVVQTCFKDFFKSRREYQADKAAVEKLDCLSGALSFMRRYENKALAFVGERIKRLEALVKD